MECVERRSVGCDLDGVAWSVGCELATPPAHWVPDDDVEVQETFAVVCKHGANAIYG